MSGGPVANAVVSFSPKQKQPVAMGKTGADGTYTLTTYDPGDGAAAGDYVVVVSKAGGTAAAAPAAIGHSADKPPDADAMHGAQVASGNTSGSDSVLPEKYSRADQSDLLAKVESKSENVLDFDLKP